MLKLFIIAFISRCVFAQHDCKSFLEIVNTAKSIVSLQEQSERNLQSNKFVTTESELFGIPENDQNIFVNAKIDSASEQANILNVAAKIIADRNQSSLEHFEDFASCLGRRKIEVGWQPKYRAISGFGNNKKNPHWGSTGAPFERFGPKNYDDGVHSIRKSVSGSDLPSPRKLVVDVLLKAEKFPRTGSIPNTMINLLVFYVSHDLAHTVTSSAFKNGDIIRCCTNNNQGILSPPLSHAACLPISIGKDDPFYKYAGIRCLDVIRSDPASLPSTIQYGEIKNMATAFMDHSVIYGVNEEQAMQIRTYCGGKLRMSKNNILPVEDNGEYVKSSERLWFLVPFGATWAVIFARNHNKLAEELEILNPHWNDEILFQEARRINIAWVQHGVLAGTLIEDIFNKKINETYDENVNPATTNEFNTAAYRFLHYFSQPDAISMNDQGQVQIFPVSDTFGRVDFLESNFTDFFRGLSAQPANFYQYTDEVN